MKSTVRTTVSLSHLQLESLQRIAESHEMSISWLIRQAVGDFLAVHNEELFHPLKRKTAQQEGNQE
ncbi:ribbon-helix-helix protein, CopG family [Aeromonas veronii]|uniref:ribbon-helix-helix protein, CopG family n=1 Tax=Aeromonas veronii TaxID=654 RepID=UPI003DA31E3C